MILEAFAVSENPQPLVPAPPNRDWMDATTKRHAYRCLPIAVANTYGWQLLLPADVTAAVLRHHPGRPLGWPGNAAAQDDRHPDGAPHDTPWREWASIIY